MNTDNYRDRLKRILALSSGAWWLRVSMLLALFGVVRKVESQSPASRLTVPTEKDRVDVPFAFRNVTVVDVEDGKLHADRTVVVVGQRIQAVGPTAQVQLPAGTRVMDARGKYLIPGLWDMHAHVHLGGNEDPAFQSSLYRITYPLFIAYGVTGIREMAQRFPGGADSFRVWQREVAEGKLVGPRTVGPSGDLSEIGRKSPIATPEDARRIIDSLKAAGDAFVKYHGDPDSAELYFPLVSEARRVGLPFVGHKPRTISLQEVVDSGQRSVEHLIPLKCFSDLGTRDGILLKLPNRAPDMGPVLFDKELCLAWAAPLIHSRTTWAVPTLANWFAISHLLAPFFLMPTEPASMSSLRARWPKDAAATMNVPLYQAIGFLHKAGVQFLAGTDVSPNLEPLPGFMLQQEVAMFVEGAGLTPLEALRTATLNPAQFFEATDSMGTIAPGKLADLVLLDANPLADIGNLAAINAVVANGRYFSRAALDTLRAQSERAWPAH